MRRFSVAAMALIGMLSVAGSGQAIEYQAETSLAAYRWVEAAGLATPKETGPMITVGAWVSGAPAVRQPALRLRGEMEFFTGWMAYDTAFLAAPTVDVRTHTFYLGSRYEGSIGWRVGTPDSSLEPFVGLGLRSWLRSIQSNSSVDGYPERYRIIYGRLGLRGVRTIAGTGFYGVASIEPLLWAREDVDLTNTVYNETLEIKNGKQTGWTLEAGLQFRAVDVGIFWRATRLGKSQVVSCNVSPFGCYQPRSDQDIIGLKLGFVF